MNYNAVTERIFMNYKISFHRAKDVLITTGSPHKLCDRLYFEFIEAMYGNIENPRIIALDCDRYSHLTSK